MRLDLGKMKAMSMSGRASAIYPQEIGAKPGIRLAVHPPFGKSWRVARET
jgi:hypothetical protein